MALSLAHAETRGLLLQSDESVPSQFKLKLKQSPTDTPFDGQNTDDCVSRVPLNTTAKLDSEAALGPGDDNCGGVIVGRLTTAMD